MKKEQTNKLDRLIEMNELLWFEITGKTGFENIENNYKQPIEKKEEKTAEEKLLTAIMMSLLEDSVFEYNSIVNKESAIDLERDIIANMRDPKDRKEIKKKYEEVASAVIAMKIKERMTSK